MTMLINVAAYNRRRITELALTQLYKHRGESTLQVYNDHSTEYDNDFLAPMCDEVIQMPERMGVHRLRWHQFRAFLKTEHEYLYLTDNDVIHDPEYVSALHSTYKKYMTADGRKLPVCIYNTTHHAHPANEVTQKPEHIFRKTAPGVSMFYDREMVERIVSVLNRVTEPDYAWDYRALEFLGLPWVTTKVSYLEHFGADGLHNPSTGSRSDYDRDRATNPTEYLSSIREDVIAYLMDDIKEIKL
jgi:hypothetical protein